MRLSEFLAAHPPDTDLTVAAWQADGDTHVRCVLRASPWWVDPAHRADAHGTLTIDCRGVADSEIRVGWRGRQVEDLEVVDDDPLLWSRGPHASIYGNAPLADPDRFLVQLADLAERVGWPRRGMTAMLGTSGEDWRRRVTGPAPYLLLMAPTPIVDACLPLLDAQQADYSVLPGARLAGDAKGAAPRLVVIGESWILCQDATVEADPPLST